MRWVFGDGLVTAPLPVAENHAAFSDARPSTHLVTSSSNHPFARSLNWTGRGNVPSATIRRIVRSPNPVASTTPCIRKISATTRLLRP